MLRKHLDWSNKEATPFISVYVSEKAAWEYAQRRKRDGWTGVGVSYIRLDAIQADCLRKVRDLAEELGLFIPEIAWRNSFHEWIILNQILKEAVFDHKFLE